MALTVPRVCFLLSFSCEKEQGTYDNNPHHDRRVSHVKDRPKTELNEVGDVTHADPVYQITRCSSKLKAPTQPEGKARQGIVAIYQKKYAYTHQRGKYQEQGLIWKQSESASCIEGVGYLDRAISRYRLMENQVMPDDRLSNLVNKKYNADNYDKKRVFVPLHPAERRGLSCFF